MFCKNYLFILLFILMIKASQQIENESTLKYLLVFDRHLLYLNQ